MYSGLIGVVELEMVMDRHRDDYSVYTPTKLFFKGIITFRRELQFNIKES